MLLRFAPALTLAVLIGPVVAGLIGVALPAFGYLPALGGTAFSLAPWREVMATPGLLTSIGLSLASGLITTAVAFGAVMLFIAGWQGTRLFAGLVHLISPLLAVPHAAAAFGLAFLIAPSGWILRLLSPELTGLTRPPDLLIVNDPFGLAMMAGLIIKEIPFLLLMTLAALPQTDAARQVRITASFGYGRIAGWTLAVLPRLYPQLRMPIFAVIAYASSVVDVALILGPTTPPPLAARLVEWMSDPDLAMRFKASAGALLQLGVTLAALAVWRIGEALAARIGHIRIWSGRRSTADAPLRLTAGLVMALTVATVAIGLAVLALWSLAGFWAFPDAFPVALTLKTWMAQLRTGLPALQTTLQIGAVATVLALILVLACLEREERTGRSPDIRALSLLYVPLIVPQIAFLFGLQILFLWLDIAATFFAVVLSHMVFVTPYVFLSLSDPWRAFDRRYITTAAAIGAGPDRIFWKIRLPMLARAVLTASAIGFAVSVGQYLPTLILGAGRWPTITTEAVALAAGGNRRVIGVYGLLQTGLPFFGFLAATLIPFILYRHRRGLKT